jgi:hypothetical protein
MRRGPLSFHFEPKFSAPAFDVLLVFRFARQPANSEDWRRCVAFCGQLTFIGHGFFDNRARVMGNR